MDLTVVAGQVSTAQWLSPQTSLPPLALECNGPTMLWKFRADQFVEIVEVLDEPDLVRVILFDRLARRGTTVNVQCEPDGGK
jgi:hypothetical protein